MTLMPDRVGVAAAAFPYDAVDAVAGTLEPAADREQVARFMLAVLREHDNLVTRRGRLTERGRETLAVLRALEGLDG